MFESHEAIIAGVGSLVAALIGGGVALKKIYTSWLSENVNQAGLTGTQTVIELLNHQLAVFRDSNRELQSEINSLRKANAELLDETDDLKRQLHSIQKENAELRNEVQALRCQVDRLAALLKG